MIALARTVARARAEASAKKAGRGVDKTGMEACECTRAGESEKRESGKAENESSAFVTSPLRHSATPPLPTCPLCDGLGYVRWKPDEELLAWGMPLIEMANRIERYGLGEVERVWGEIDPLGLMMLEAYEQELAG